MVAARALDPRLQPWRHHARQGRAHPPGEVAQVSHELRHVHGALDGPEGEGRLFMPSVAMIAEGAGQEGDPAGASAGPGAGSHRREGVVVIERDLQALGEFEVADGFRSRCGPRSSRCRRAVRRRGRSRSRWRRGPRRGAGSPPGSPCRSDPGSARGRADIVAVATREVRDEVLTGEVTKKPNWPGADAAPARSGRPGRLIGADRDELARFARGVGVGLVGVAEGRSALHVTDDELVDRRLDDGGPTGVRGEKRSCTWFVGGRGRP